MCLTWAYSWELQKAESNRYHQATDKAIRDGRRMQALHAGAAQDRARAKQLTRERTRGQGSRDAATGPSRTERAQQVRQKKLDRWREQQEQRQARNDAIQRRRPSGGLRYDAQAPPRGGSGKTGGRAADSGGGGGKRPPAVDPPLKDPSQDPCYRFNMKRNTCTSGCSYESDKSYGKCNSKYGQDMSYFAKVDPKKRAALKACNKAVKQSYGRCMDGCKSKRPPAGCKIWGTGPKRPTSGASR